MTTESELPPYNPNAICPKCRFGVVSVQWHASSGVWCQSHGLGSIFDPEHLARICQRCGYAWAEASIPEEDE